MMIKVNRCLALAAPVIAAFFLVSPAANAAHCNNYRQQFGAYGQQYGAYNQPYGSYSQAYSPYSQAYSPYGSFQQNLASGMLTPAQAQDLARRQNDLATRAAKLLRNDGGVLTPHDSAKLQQASLDIQQRYNDYVAQNSGSNAYGGNTGILGSLFGGGVPGGLNGLGAYNPYGTASYNPYAGNSLLGNQFGTSYGGNGLAGLARNFLGY